MDDLYKAFDDRAQVILNRARRARLGSARRRHRVHRPRAAHDVAADRPEASDVRRGARPRSTATRSSASTAAPTSSSAKWSSALDPGTQVLIVSDHGFHSWRKAVNLNTWLVQQGYMVLQGQQPGEKKLDDLFGGGKFWENVDWTQTRAYAMGLGQIYFNLRGREVQRHRQSRRRSHGSSPTSCSAQLLTMTDPDDGSPIIRAVYKRDDVYSGEYLAECVGAAGRHGRRLSRVVADHARRIAAGHRLSEHEEVERRSRRLRLRDHVRRADLEPADRRTIAVESSTSPRRC